jgi:hypothetical protein
MTAWRSPKIFSDPLVDHLGPSHVLCLFLCPTVFLQISGIPLFLKVLFTELGSYHENEFQGEKNTRLLNMSYCYSTSDKNG